MIPQRFPFRATTLGLSLIVLLLIVDAMVAERNVGRLVENSHRVVQSQEVLTTLQQVLATVTQAETAERGLLITDEPQQYMQPYERAVQQTGVTLARLKELMADDPVQRPPLADLEERVQARLQELGEAIAAHEAGGFDAAKTKVSTNQGRQLMNEMRLLVAKMQRHEEALLAERTRESQHSAKVTTVAGYVGTLPGIAMVCLAWVLFRRDLAHRRQAEEASLRLAFLVQSSGDAIVSKTLDGTVVSWNVGAERVYGYSAEEMVGRPIFQVCPAEHAEEIRHILERVKHGQPIEHFETTRLRKDGRRIDISLSISPLKDASGAVIGASAIGRDITERKALQREVLEIAGREQRRIGQDLHDGIGQELTGLAMLGQRLVGLLTGQSLPEGKAAAKIVDGLEQALSHLRALSRGLLPVDVDAEGLMAALADLAGRTSELNSIDCTFDCPEPVCILDNQTATHLYRMTQEAVTNALKHGRASRIAIELVADGDLIHLQITDNGTGLDESAKEANGLGLRIMRYRAELIGAQLTFGQAEPHGLRVTCTLLHRHAPAAAVVS